MKNQKLQAARKTRRWSSEVAAEKIGISPITYSRWENGKQTPYLSTLDQLCRVFQQSPEELGFLPDGSKDPGTTTVLWETQAGQAVSHPVLSTGEAFRLAMMGLILAQRQNHWTLEELRLQIERELGTINDMNQPSQPDVSRREVLAFLAGLPLALYGLTTTERKPSPLASEDLLPLYAASIPACWNLWGSGHLAEAERVLPAHLSHLTPLAEQPSARQKNAAGLASQAHQLAAVLSMNHEDFGASLTHCKQALRYAQIAQDPNLIAGAFLREDDTLFYRKRDTLQMLQQAEHCTPKASPLMRGRIYSSLAASYAKHEQKQQALRYIGLAQETFPEHPEHDPGFPYTHTNHYILYLHEMLLHLRLSQPQDAWQAIMKAGAFVPDNVSPRRAELLYQLITASIALNDLEQGCFYFEKLATLGTTLGANLFISETQASYQEIRVRWPHEVRIKALGELLHA